MNDGNFSTFIDMKKMKDNGLICDEKALIHQRQIDEICRIIKERMEYGEYNPSQRLSRRMMSSPSLQDEVLVRQLL